MRNLFQVGIFAPHGLSNLHKGNENVNCEYYYKQKFPHHGIPKSHKLAQLRLVIGFELSNHPSDQSLFECRKYSVITLVLHYFAL